VHGALPVGRVFFQLGPLGFVVVRVRRRHARGRDCGRGGRERRGTSRSTGAGSGVPAACRRQ
jgi:hypothetical protein